MRQEMTAQSQQDAVPGLVAASVPVVLLTDNSPPVAGAVRQAHQYLTAAGHQSAVRSLQDWATAEETAPIILLYVDDDGNTPLKLCREIKSRNENEAVLVVLPMAGAEEQFIALRADLWSAGAAGIFSIHNSVAELEAFVGLLARLALMSRELAATREELERVTQLDNVTRLLNRRSFFQNAHRECSRARRYQHPLSCLMIAVNYFEHFNKNFGYACGDYLLGAVANALRETTRDTDIAARFSDKKIVVLLPETDLAGAALTREKLEQAITNSTFAWREQNLPVSISIGESERRREAASAATGSTQTDDDEDHGVSVRVELADLLEEADAALAVARKGARCPDIFVEDDLPAAAAMQLPGAP